MVEEERKLHFSAESCNVGLIESATRILPVLAQRALLGERQHVGTSIGDGPEDAAVLSGQRAGELLSEIRRTQHACIDPMGGTIRPTAEECESMAQLGSFGGPDADTSGLSNG